MARKPGKPGRPGRKRYNRYFGRGRDGARSRELYLQQNPLCVACDYAAAEEVDHIVPLSEGGKDVAANRQPLCKRCHKKKSKGEYNMRALMYRGRKARKHHKKHGGGLAWGT